MRISVAKAGILKGLQTGHWRRRSVSAEVKYEMRTDLGPVFAPNLPLLLLFFWVGGSLVGRPYRHGLVAFEAFASALLERALKHA